MNKHGRLYLLIIRVGENDYQWRTCRFPSDLRAIVACQRLINSSKAISVKLRKFTHKRTTLIAIINGQEHQNHQD